MVENNNMMLTNYLLEKSLNVESLRRRVIANNIANVDVPHFKRSEVNFESDLKRAIEDANDPVNKLPAKMNHRKHIPFYVPKNIREVQSRVNLDYNTTYRNDGNNVDIEKEIVDSSKNMMRYNGFVTMLNHNFKLLKIAMKPS
ncbi:flagellar basal body rod protein FlgB [Spirochaetota bacterium]